MQKDIIPSKAEPGFIYRINSSANKLINNDIVLCIRVIQNNYFVSLQANRYFNQPKGFTALLITDFTNNQITDNSICSLTEVGQLEALPCTLDKDWNKVI